MVAQALSPRNKNKTFAKLPTEKWGCDFNQAAPAELIVTGREGYNETLNGRYLLGEGLHEGRVYYKHTERKFVIRWCPAKGSWFFDWRGLNTDTTASGALAEDVESPHLATKAWRVYDGSKWISDAKITLNATVESMSNEVKIVEIEQIVAHASSGGVSV